MVIMKLAISAVSFNFLFSFIVAVAGLESVEVQCSARFFTFNTHIGVVIFVTYLIGIGIKRT